MFRTACRGAENWLVGSIFSFTLYFQQLFFVPFGHPPEIGMEGLLPTYDFIIVGAGSAGAVLANRLTEIDGWNVLLVEAGDDESAISDVPVVVSYLQRTSLDWDYKTEPSEEFCRAMIDHRCNWPRGKVMGGSSVLNYMIYTRGNKRDYDSWALKGNRGWSYAELLPYFKKSEDMKISDLELRYHGYGGYLTVDQASRPSSLAEYFLVGGQEMGFNILDYNGENQSGFSYPQGTIRNGARCSTNKAFLTSIRGRKNLHISKKSYVTKILIDPLTKKTIGVKFIKDGQEITIKSTKEVILSAGTINTPQLLMLSGVGPRRHLEAHKIPVIKDLKVGYNLQDHVGLGGLTYLINEDLAYSFKSLANFANIYKYFVIGKGGLTMMGCIEGLAFVHTKYGNASLDYPDIQFHFLSGALQMHGEHYKTTVGLSDEFYNKTFKPIYQQHGWTIVPYILRPKSRGFIKLKTANPFDKPLIYPNYFKSDLDMKILIEGAKIAHKLTKTSKFLELNSTLHQFPDCNEHTPLSDSFWECMIRQFTVTIYHPVGTAKMGPPKDKQAVVNPNLEVYGVQGLRVIDASVMPTLISGNTNAVVIMIAEKGADLIKKRWLTYKSL